MKLLGYEIEVKKAKALPFPSTRYTYTLPGDSSASFTRAATFEQIVREGFYANAAVQGCVSAYTMTMPEAPFFVEVNGQRQDKHPLALLLQKPGEGMSQAQLMAFTAAYQAIGGNAYLVKVRNAMKGVIGLVPYHDGHITPIPGQYEFISRYQYNVQGYKEDRLPQDVVHIRGHIIDPLAPYKALSPILAAARNVDIYAALEQTVYNTLKNDILPRGLISFPPNVSLGPDQRAVVIDQLQQLYGDKGRTMVMSDGAKYERLSMSLEEIQADNIFSKAEVSICQAFRVHPLVAMTYAGLLRSTYSNMEEAFKQFTVLTRVPLWQSIAGTLTASFAAEFPGAVVKVDLQQVEALRPTPEQKQKAAQDQYTANIITLNEARELIGAKQLGPDGDTFAYQRIPQIATPTVQVPSKAAPSEPAPAEPKTVTQDYLGRDLSAYGKVYWKQLDDKLEGHAQAIAKAYAVTLVRLQKEVVAHHVKAGGPFDLEKWTKEFLAGTKLEREALVKDVLQQSLEDVGFTVEQFAGYYDSVLSAAVIESVDKIAESIGTIRGDLQQLLVRNANATPKELAQLLGAEFETLSTARAELIGRTTATATSGATQTETWKEVNKRIVDSKKKIKRVWITRNDGAVRSSHSALNRQPESVDGTWNLGGATVRWPGDRAAKAADACNCRCVLMPVRAEDL